MIIVVEGIDRVGKTTLCNRLSEELNIPIYKHSQRVMTYSDMDNVNETDKMLQLLDMCSLLNADIIFDRFHFSDYVYGILERRYDAKRAMLNLSILDTTLSEMNAILVFIFPTNIKSSSNQHGKDLIPYFKLMTYAYDKSKMHSYSCDYNSIDDIVNQIQEKYYAQSSI
jgi:thymidylate kinase